MTPHFQRVRRSVLALAALSFAGCSLAPVYVRPAIQTPETFKEQGPWVDAAPADQMQRADWWQLYGDATLNDLETKVDVANPDLAAAVDRYTQARAYLDETRSGFFPQLAGGAQATHNRQSDDRPLRSASQPDEYKDNLIGAQLGYELDLWGRVRNLVSAGRASAQAYGADLASVRLSLHAELANDYISVRGLDAQAKLLADTVEAYAHALQLTENRFSGGIASGLDVARARTQLSTARALISDIKAQRALFEHAIASLVGVPASSFSLQPTVAEMPLPPIPVSVPSTLLQRRPDIAAAERRAAAANANIGVARAAFFPNIALTATGGYENTGGANWLTAPNSFWSIGPRISLPIFDAGRRRAIEQEARAVFDEASDRYRGIALTAFQQVEDNLALLRWLGEEEKDESAAVASAQQTLDLALDRYRNGAVNYLEVVDSQVTALAAQRIELTLQDRQLRASIGLIRALGGGWSMAELNEQATSTGTHTATR
jgi:NodT family efflux transporter outer membrane factor (OMF) lipoprotein